MLNIPVYDIRGRIVSYKNYEYNEQTPDATGTFIFYPDRLIGYVFGGYDVQIIKKDFYLRNDGVAVEMLFEQKQAQYKKINDLFLSKSEVVQAIENRLTDLKITAIQAKYAFEKVAGGTEAEKLFKTLSLIGTANNMVVSNVINLSLGFSNSQWKTALRNFLENLEREWNALNQKLNFLTGQYSALDNSVKTIPTKTQNTESSTAKNTTAAQNAGNSNDTFTIVALVAAVVLIFKKLKKRK